MGRLALIGTGLIGGSIGLALRSRARGHPIVGYDRDPRAGQTALERGAVSELASSASEAVGGADVVVLATPIEALAGELATLAPWAGDAVVTDVGSAKAEVVDAGHGALGDRFIGGHPMTGSERHGIEAAHEDLFDDAWWILTPTELTSASAYSTVRYLAQSLGARPIALAPDAHDALVARLSHVPQLAASALVEVALADGADDSLLALAGGGFRDVTRIAASNPALWVPIIRSNRSAVLAVLARLEDRCARLGETIRQGRWHELHEFLAASRSARLELFVKPAQVEHPVTIALVVPDRPGVLAEVTTAAGELGANIEDLRIIHSTEGGRGRLELVISGKPAAEALVAALHARGYRAERADDVEQ
jgi:prephenate dehydrogenase